MMVGPDGFEPSTSRLSAVRSNQLSYEPVPGQAGRIATIARPGESVKCFSLPGGGEPFRVSRMIAAGSAHSLAREVVRVVRVRIATITMDSANSSPVVLLRPVDDEGDFVGERVIPIWIGHPEAMAILLGIQDVEPQRPLTHDLLLNTLHRLGYALEQVQVTKLEGGTFHAEIVLRGPEERLEIDARPSDSMALAVREGCPIYVCETVMEEAAVVPEPADEAEAEEEVERFRRFLDSVDPSDFLH